MRMDRMGRVAALVVMACLVACLAVGDAGAAVRKGKLGGGSAPAPHAGAPARAMLPKKGDIAVVVDGPDGHHVRMAEAAIVEELVSRGYRVVDEGKMRKIRAAAAKAKAARLALEGDVEGILKINASYSVAATVVANVRAGRPRTNEFDLYTGTASVALMAVTSNGTRLGGQTAEGKQVGYTEDEAQQKAIDAAVRAGMSRVL
ncbi:MAG: hypothetical protein IJR14_10630 [Synergistaceae bacterium]|nr:hypothetical protein [Synergistaceae bacterium]